MLNVTTMCAFYTVCAGFGLLSSGAFAQERTVAITVDDLPYAAGPVSTSPAAQAASANMANHRFWRRFAHAIFP